MYRRYPAGVLVAGVLFVATFVTEPRATSAFTWQAFKAVGEFGGALVSEITDTNRDGDDVDGEGL